MTGSVRAGRTIAGVAGAAGKKAVLELGGSDPFIVFADADFDVAVKTAVAARLNNTGQSCVCAKRFLVEKTIAGKFTEAFVAGMAAANYGDPLDERFALGPMARVDLRAGLQHQLDRSLAGGARVALAGGSVEGAGYFFAPVVLTDVGEDNVAAREELFGPVAPIFAFADEADAVRLANGTEFGLAAAVWTSDEARAAPARGVDRGRRGVHQRHGALRRAYLVRRHQVFGLWSRTRPRRHPRIHQRQDHLDRLRRPPP